MDLIGSVHFLPTPRSSAYPRLQVDADPVLLDVYSDPGVFFTAFGYQMGIHVRDRRARDFILLLGPASLAKQLERMRVDNNGTLVGLRIWVRKQSYDRKAPYVVDLAS